MVRASLAAGQGWVLGLGTCGCSPSLALYSVQSFGPKSASLSVPSYLSVGLPACMTQLPCQPGSACPAFRFAASCVAGQAVGESARAAGASPEPSLWREATQSREPVPLQGEPGPEAWGRQALERPRPSSHGVSTGLQRRLTGRLQGPGRMPNQVPGPPCRVWRWQRVNWAAALPGSAG